ncbi:flagellar hook-length control protein FliK [Sedimentibacter sp.]|uniref:flagellar hook-length control protein FliK n=1 Tax=Sedimentibacter sp. TaxID=1960295 RepID=UPI0028ADE49B|nr:flagellar hook-length control protein FliK [Sedimentibacter sp.]
MNVNMDLNNVLNQVQNNLNTNMAPVMGKDTFLAMLTNMMTDNSLNQLPVITDNTEMNNEFMEFLTGSGTDYLNLLNMNNIDINPVITETDVFTSDGDKTEKSDAENILESSYLMQNYFNLIAPQIMGITENTGSNSDAYMLPELNNLQSLNHGIYENSFLNNGNTSYSNMKPSDINAEQVHNEKTALSPQAEKLITEIEGRRDKLKNDINFNAETLNANANKNITPENNKIIQLNDESTQIKSQVLEQVRDNIVMLTEANKGDGNTVKQVTMELYPKELGKVDIKMTMVDNKMTVEVKALNEETQKILASNGEELLKLLNKTSETVSIVIKSNDSSQEHHLTNYYDKENQNNEYNQDDQNLDQDNKRRNYYFYEEDGKNSDDDTFSELINLRSAKINQ